MRNHEYLTPDELGLLGFATIGVDVRIHRSCVLVGCELMTIGSHIRIDPFCIITISSRLVIGDYVHIAGHAAIVGRGEIKIGDHANVSHGVKLLSSSDHFSAGGMAGPLVPESHRLVEHGAVTLGRHTIVGAGSVLLPGAQLGEGVTVGALSLVKSSIPAWKVYAGVPARLLGERDREAVMRLEREFRESRSRAPFGHRQK